MRLRSGSKAELLTESVCSELLNLWNPSYSPLKNKTRHFESDYSQVKTKPAIFESRFWRDRNDVIRLRRIRVDTSQEKTSFIAVRACSKVVVLFLLGYNTPE